MYGRGWRTARLGRPGGGLIYRPWPRMRVHGAGHVVRWRDMCDGVMDPAPGLVWGAAWGRRLSPPRCGTGATRGGRPSVGGRFPYHTPVWHMGRRRVRRACRICKSGGRDATRLGGHLRRGQWREGRRGGRSSHTRVRTVSDVPGAPNPQAQGRECARVRVAQRPAPYGPVARGRRAAHPFCPQRRKGGDGAPKVGIPAGGGGKLLPQDAVFLGCGAHNDLGFLEIEPLFGSALCSTLLITTIRKRTWPHLSSYESR